MNENGFRNKVTWFTFFLSVLVIWVHSYNAVLFLGYTHEAAVLDRLERLLGDGIGQIAVPGFFMISSLLFFRNFSMDQLKRKWKRRIQSVLVPYLLWNTIYYIGYVMGSRIPGLSQVIGKGEIPLDLPAILAAVFFYQYNYVFWYLHQLILLIVLAPLIYIAIKRVWTAIVFLGAVILGIFLGIDLLGLNLDALFYYSAAAAAAVHGRRLTETNGNRRKIGLGMACLAVGLIIRRFDLPGNAIGEAAAATVIFRFLAPAALWLMVPQEVLPAPGNIAKNNFFLYAVHFALVRLINKTGALLLPSLWVIPLLFFLFMPAVLAIISWAFASLLKKSFPRLWRLLNGNR